MNKDTPLPAGGTPVASLTPEVTVVGLGYVGFPILLMLARAGLRAAGFDVDQAKMADYVAGRCPISEPKLQEIFDEVRSQGGLTFLDGLGASEVFLIAVPTPLEDRKKTADMGALTLALRSIVPHLAPGNLVIVNSTIPPMCCRETVIPLLEQSGLTVGSDIELCYCPERLYPGNIAYEIVHNDHIIGGHTPGAARRAAALYRHFVEGELLITDDLTAEFCKLIENTYRDVNIALANELGLIAERLGTEIGAAIALANRHPRVNLLEPGIGVGGHCLPIDPWFIAEMAPEESVLIPTARRLNDSMPLHTAAKIRRAARDRRDARIGCLGVTYKPDVNDERESPAWEIIHLLEADGYNVRAYDPVVNVGHYTDLAQFVASVDVVVMLVPHRAFKDALDNNPELRDGKLWLEF